MTGRNSRRRIGRKIGRSFGRNFLDIFVLHSLCRTTHQNFSPNSSQFITPCLVTAPGIEISKFHLREFLGLGVPKNAAWGHPKAKTLFSAQASSLCNAGLETSKVLAGWAFCKMQSQDPQFAFQGFPGVAGGGGSATVCDPNPTRPFARYIANITYIQFCFWN